MMSTNDNVDISIYPEPHRGDCYIRQWNRNLIALMKIDTVRSDGTIVVKYIEVMPESIVRKIPAVITGIIGWTPLSRKAYAVVHAAKREQMFAYVSKLL